VLLSIEREKIKSIKTAPFKISQNSTLLKFSELVALYFDKNGSENDVINKLSVSINTINAMVKTEISNMVFRD
jgi:hypothetical protein